MEEVLGVLGFVLLIILAATQYSLYEKIKKMKKYLNNIYLESAGDSHAIYKRVEKVEMDLEVLNVKCSKYPECKCDNSCKKEEIIEEENVEEYLKQVEEEAEKKVSKPKRIRKPRTK